MRESDIKAMTAPPPPAAETILFPTVTVNGDTDNSSLTKVKRDASGAFSFDRASLQPLRFDMTQVPEGDWVPATLLGPAQIKFDEATQKMEMTVPAKFLVRSTLASDRTVQAHILPTAWGALFNYQGYATNDQTGKNGTYSIYGDFRVLSPYGVLTNTGIYTNVQGRQTFMRYETTWTNSWPDRLLTANVGDLTTGGLTWTSPVRMAGFQLSKSFALRPDMITFPVPSFSGSAAATSAVDLYVNHAKQYSGQVVSGPFTLNSVPSVTGAGTADVVVHDALGRDTVQHLNFYIEPRLLAQGLDNYSIEAGFLRRFYGSQQADYDRMPAFSASYKKGVTNNFTLEAHAEGGGDYHPYAAGVGGIWSLPKQLGVINASTLADVDGRGANFTLGYANLRQGSGVFASVSKTLGTYTDLSSVPGYSTSPLQWQTGVSFPMGKRGSISLNYVNAAAIPGLDESKRRTVGLTYSLQPFSNLNVFVSAQRDMGSIKSTSLLLGLSYSFTNGISVNTQTAHASGDKGVSLDTTVQKSAPYDVGFGWEVTGKNSGQDRSGSATVMYRNNLIDTSLGVGQDQQNTLFQANVSGSVLFMDKDLLLGRNVSDGFALVGTGYPNVPVLRENRFVGATNSRGHLLVNDVNPYENTIVAIDPRQLPAGVDAPVLSQTISTKANAGVMVDFKVKPLYGAVITLHGADGKPLPLGASVILDTPGAQPQVVGYDGVVFMTGLDKHNTLKVTLPTGTCNVSFDYTSSTGKIPQIGPLVCR